MLIPLCVLVASASVGAYLFFGKNEVRLLDVVLIVVCSVLLVLVANSLFTLFVRVTHFWASIGGNPFNLLDRLPR